MSPNTQLRLERELRGWSQAKVASALGTSAKIVSRWECGSSYPSPYFRAQLCELYNKNAYDLGLIPSKNESALYVSQTASGPLIEPQDHWNEPSIFAQETLPAQQTEPPLILVQETVSAQRQTKLLQETALTREQEILPIIQMQNVSAATSVSIEITPSRQPRVWGKYIKLITFLAVLSIFIIFTRIFVVNVPFSSGSNAQANDVFQPHSIAEELNLEKQLYLQKNIGISDGTYIFDTYAGRQDVSLKQQVGSALAHQDTSSAVNLLTQAVTIDPTDGEAQIYNENLHVVQSGQPSITLVLGLPIDAGPDLLIARVDMQAAFLAQHEFNNAYSGTSQHLKVRILIDNSGANNNDVARVAQFIKNRVRLGNEDQIVGVIGWPFSSQTIDARDIIASVHLPLISQTASSNLLSGSSPYFFRVNPPDQVQGTTLGNIALQSLDAHTIFVLRDPTDTYSVSLSDTFSRQVEWLQGQAINSSDGLFSEKVTTVQDYQHMIERAQSSHADMIFCACLDVDAIRLAHALGNLERASPHNVYLQNVKLLGGDAIDTGLLLGLGTGSDADIVHQFPQDLQRLHFAAFGHPDEWNFLHIPLDQQPQFFTDWNTTYQMSPIMPNSASDSTSDVLLTYDAVNATLNAISLVRGPVTGDQLRNALKSLGNGSVPAYQGIAGRIAFDDEGNPIDKALVLLDVDVVHGQTTIKLMQIVGNLR